MESAQEFMESYLKAKAELSRENAARFKTLHERYYGGEHLQRLLELRTFFDQNPETCINTETDGKSARAITIQPVRVKTRQMKFRYHLVSTGTSWQIHQRETECAVCRLRSNPNCKICNGTGWIDPNRQLPE